MMPDDVTAEDEALESSESSGQAAAFQKLKRAAAVAETPKKFVAALESDSNSLQQMLEKAFGFQGASFALHLFAENDLSFGQVEERIATFAGLEAIIAIAPKGPMQSMLAVQMLSVHLAAGKAMRQASSAAPEMTELYINRSTKLMRLYAQQVELLARLQGKITQQRIVVEKVNVNDGGQAIVGAIGAGSGAGNE
jgi:hypothetical protein